MAKQILHGEESRQAVLRGINTVADAVKVTLGPKGRTVIIKRSFGYPHLTKDGISVAKEVSLKDPLENVGAEIIREAAQRTVDAAGDGTTTATVLAQAIAKEGFKLVAAGANPTALKRGIDKAVEAIVGKRDPETKKFSGGALQSIATEITSNSLIAQVGTVSANGDASIGQLFADAMDRVGRDGVIAVDNSNTTETYLEVVDGMDFDRGFVSPYFANNGSSWSITSEEGVRIFLVDGKISTVSDIKSLLDAWTADNRKPLLIIADDIDGEALQVLVYNRIQNNFPYCAVKSPGFGDRRKAMIQDIAVLTGATIISPETGTTLTSVKANDFGRARKVSVTNTQTTIIDGFGDKGAIEARAAEIRSGIDSASSDFEREKLRERLAKISGGVALIKIGAVTEIELKEKRDRVEDALHATRAAVEEGIVPGGGTALLRCLDALDSVYDNAIEEEKHGVDIIRKALQSPLRQIAKNCGVDDGVVLGNVMNGFGINYGYNAANGTFGDLIVSGIIDPTKVVRVSLQNAASISGTLLTTECLMVEMPDPPQPIIAQMAPGM